MTQWNGLTRTELHRGTGLPPRKKGIRKRSPKREREREFERALYARVLQEEPTCRACRSAQSTDPHHILPRSSGRERLERSNLMGVCRQCHDALTNPPGWFRQIALGQGWLRSRFEVAPDA